MLDKLSEPEFRENLMAVTPGLREDPITFGEYSDRSVDRKMLIRFEFSE